jgi:hypothetical protein
MAMKPRKMRSGGMVKKPNVDGEKTQCRHGKKTQCRHGSRQAHQKDACWRNGSENEKGRRSKERLQG